jgi:hypothetical protein
MVCPANHKIDTSCISLGYVKTGAPKKNNRADFTTQLQRMAMEASAIGGNTMVISSFRDVRQSGSCNMKFNVFKCRDISTVSRTSFRLKDDNLSEVILYRPIYSGSYNDSVTYEVVVNDTLRLNMESNRKYVLRISAGSSIKLSVVSQGIVAHINTVAGKTYYVRGFVNIPGVSRSITNDGVSRITTGYMPYIEQVEELQGELESSFLNQYTILKKI